MATYKAVANGNWSSLAIWQDNAGGSFVASSVLPGVGDDVYPNGFVVQIDQTISVKSLRCSAITGVLVNGRFEISSNVNVTTVNGIFPQDSGGISTAYTAVVKITAPCTTIINSNITYTLGGTYRYGVEIAANANVTIIGIFNGNASNAVHCIRVSNDCTLNLIGTCGNSTLRTGTLTLACNISIIGNLGSQAIAYTGPTVTIIGNAEEFYSIVQSGGHLASFTGNAKGSNGTNYFGIYISNGTVGTLTGNFTGGVTAGAYALYTTLSIPFKIVGNIYASSIVGGVYCVNATPTIEGSLYNYNELMAIVTSKMYLNPTNPAQTWVFKDSTNTDNGLYAVGTQLGFPTEANTRLGTVYGPNSEFTGTAAIPPKASVALNVPVDNTVGELITATTPADFIAALKADDLGIRLGKCATTEEVDSTVAGYIV